MFIIGKLQQCRLDFTSFSTCVFLFIFSSLSIGIYVFLTSKAYPINSADNADLNTINVSVTKIKENSNMINLPCNVFTCFDVYRCGNRGNQLLVYVYPYKENVKLSKELTNNFLINEFYSILQAIRMSKYYTSNIEEACIFVPSIDLSRSYQNNKHTYKSQKMLH